MADWRRRSIAGGLSPETPNEDNPGALHLDFFYRPIAFPCDRAGGSGAGSSKDLGGVSVIMPGRRLIREIADEAFVLHGADRNGGDRKMTVALPATIGTALQPRQCQPAGTAPTGGCGGSRLRVKRPSSSQPPPLPDNATETFVDIEAGSDDEEAGEEEEEEATSSSGRSNDDEEEETMSWSGRSKDHEEETMSSGRSNEVEEEEEAMLSGRSEDDAVYCDDALLSAIEEGEEEEPEVQDNECVECGTLERLRKLIPCRHACYCLPCFVTSCRRNGPARCPVCWRKYTGGYH